MAAFLKPAGLVEEDAELGDKNSQSQIVRFSGTGRSQLRQSGVLYWEAGEHVLPEIGGCCDVKIIMEVLPIPVCAAQCFASLASRLCMIQTSDRWKVTCAYFIP